MPTSTESAKYGLIGTKSDPMIWRMCLSIEKMKVDSVDVLISRIRYLLPFTQTCSKIGGAVVQFAFSVSEQV